jgi:O-antigen ligase
VLTAPARGLRLPSPTLPPRVALLAAAVLVVALAGAESVRSPRHVLILAFGLVLVYVTFRWLLVGTVLFTIVTFPAQLPGALGNGATIAKPFGVILAASWLLAMIGERRRPFLLRDRPLLGACLVAYVGWALLSLLWSQSSGDTVSNLRRLVLAFVFVLVLYSVAATRRDFLVLAAAYVAASGVTSAFVLASGVSISGGRVTGGVSDPNYLASEIVLAMILGGYLLGATSRQLARFAILGIIGLDLAVFLLTQSRGGIIGLGVGLAVALAVAGHTRATVFGVVAIATAVAVGYFALIAPAHVRHRVTNISASSSAGRSDSWQIAWKIAKAHPVNGVALGGFRDEQLKYVASSTIDVHHITYILDFRLVVHNTYLETLAELGVVGFVLLGGSVLIPLGAGWQAIRLAEARGDAAFANTVRGLLAGACGLFTAYIFVSAEYERQLWFAIALLAASSRLAARRD